ncbi:hypothetical protein NMG60_11031102 [Bertholletia excelsa]
MCHCSYSTDTVKMFVCLDGDGLFPFGIYGDALPLFSGSSVPDKILYTNLWAFFMIRYMMTELERMGCLVIKKSLYCMFLIYQTVFHH